MTIHGSSYLDQRMSVDGVQVRNLIGEGNATNFAPDMGSTQEVTIEYGAGSVEQFTGGVRINFIPREGGNTFKGSFFATGVNQSFQANNITEDLKARGLGDPNALDKQYDFNPTSAVRSSATGCGSTRAPGGSPTRTSSPACTRTRTPATPTRGSTTPTTASRRTTGCRIAASTRASRSARRSATKSPLLPARPSLLAAGGSPHLARGVQRDAVPGQAARAGQLVLAGDQPPAPRGAGDDLRRLPAERTDTRS